MEKKITVLTISDHPFYPSGVGQQSKMFIEALLESGKFKIVSIGAAINQPTDKIQQINEDWLIYPTEDYGNQLMIRSLLRLHKVDILWFMTDPRFYPWLWDIENEIRPLCPMVYYHVWDNYPVPLFNEPYYSSTDVIVTISKITDDIVKKVTPNIERYYLPHASNNPIYQPRDPAEVSQFKNNNFAFFQDRCVFLWVNRNARRKQSGTLVWWFNNFLNKVGRDKASLIMHTDAKDINGQDLERIVMDCKFGPNEIKITQEKYDDNIMSLLYNMADCTINISDAEGFGLSCQNSLNCGTPVIVNRTGGLQEQASDGENDFGVIIEPRAKAIIGSQECPYIYEDRIVEEDFHIAMEKMLNMSKDEREKLGMLGRQHMLKNYNPEDFKKKWVEIMLNIHEKYGSWDERKEDYKSWKLKEIKL